SANSCFSTTTQIMMTRCWTKWWNMLAHWRQKAGSRWKLKQLEKAQRSCSARKLHSRKSYASATVLDLQRRKSVLIFSLVASWCNGSTRDSGSLCLGSSPSEAVAELRLLQI